MRFVPLIAIALALALAAACGEGDNTPPDQTDTEDTMPDDAQEMPFAEACVKTDEKRFSEAPPRIIDTGKTYVAMIRTSKGDIAAQLSSDVPVTTNNFVFLACKGFYDGLTFHRVEPGFVIQGGDPQGTGAGGPGYTIPGEFEGAVFDQGVLAMARTQDPDSAGSQFFITLGAAHHLDGAYAAFGRVTAGMDVAQQIAVGDTIQSISIEER